MREFEVLSPAGDVENLKIAITSGADAVYFGLNKFNARMKADNISMDNLSEIVKYAHLKGVRTYVTINTLLSDSELRELVDMVGECLVAGVDAFIVQDYGVIGVLKEVYPNIVLHGSTQLGVHNVRGARVAKELGLSRVVLSREVTLEDIREIRENVDIELEVFVQGAMCVCFSGNCYLSSLKFGASGNRGLCKQLCRLGYTLADSKSKSKGYMLSPRDNCMLDYLEDLYEAGVVSLKIEGRLRRGGYVAVATRNYRNAVDSIIYGIPFNKVRAEKELKKVFSRGEFISGYFEHKNIIDSRNNAHLGEKIGKVISSTRFKDLYKITISSSVELASGDGLKIIDNNNEVITLGVGNIERIGNNTVVYGKNSAKIDAVVYRVLDSEFENTILDLSKKRLINLSAKVVVGEPLKLTAVCDELIEVSVVGEVVQQAQKAPVTQEKIIDNLSKWDRDIFEVVSVNFEEFSDNAFLPISAINELRRELVAKVTDSILEEYKQDTSRNSLPQLFESVSPVDNMVIVDERADAKKLDEYSKVILAPSVYSVEVVDKFYQKHRNVLAGRFVVSLPIVALTDDLKVLDDIVAWAKANDVYIMANNIYALDYIRDGAKVISSYNMNTTNSYAYSHLKKLGVEEIIFSCEKWCNRVQGAYKLGSGKRVLMTMAHCPYTTLKGSGCERVLGDKNSGCSYSGELRLFNENNSYTIRRYRIANCYFELLDEFREDKSTSGVVIDLRN